MSKIAPPLQISGYAPGHGHMFNIENELSYANEIKFMKQLASCKDTVYCIAY